MCFIDFRILAKKPQTDALIRTTTAVTIIKGGTKDNVIPSYAEFVVNHRLHSLDSCADVIRLYIHKNFIRSPVFWLYFFQKLKIVAYDLKVIADSRIQYQVLDCSEPSPISSSTSLGYTLIEHTTRQIFPTYGTMPGMHLIQFNLT